MEIVFSQKLVPLKTDNEMEKTETEHLNYKKRKFIKKIQNEALNSNISRKTDFFL